MKAVMARTRTREAWQRGQAIATATARIAAAVARTHTHRIGGFGRKFFAKYGPKKTSAKQSSTHAALSTAARAIVLQLEFGTRILLSWLGREGGRRFSNPKDRRRSNAGFLSPSSPFVSCSCVTVARAG